MKKYVFTNISDSLKLSEIEKIVNAKPNVAISPVQKSLNTVCIDAYYTDTQPKGVIVNLPLFDGKYITLEPKDFVTINAITDKQCNFYDKIVNTFTNNKTYKILNCETSSESNTDDTPSGDGTETQLFSFDLKNGQIDSKGYATGALSTNISLKKGSIYKAVATYDNTPYEMYGQVIEVDNGDGTKTPALYLNGASSHVVPNMYVYKNYWKSVKPENESAVADPTEIVFTKYDFVAQNEPYIINIPTDLEHTFKDGYKPMGIGTVEGKLNLTAGTEYDLGTIMFNIMGASMYRDTQPVTATKGIPLWSVDQSDIDENKYTYVRAEGVFIIDSCAISLIGTEEPALKYTHDDTKYSFIIGVAEGSTPIDGVDLGTDYIVPAIIKLSEAGSEV